jgi:hypothetical protein
MAMLGAVVGVAGAAVSAAGTMAAGRRTRAAAERQAMLERILGKREAEVFTIAANTAQAAGQQNALQKGMQLTQVQGQARAAAGASGGGADDTSVLNVQTTIAHVGEFQKAIEVFSGENKARGMRYQATLAEIGGENQARATEYGGQVAEANARDAAMGSLIGGFDGLFGSIGGGGGNMFGFKFS